MTIFNKTITINKKCLVSAIALLSSISMASFAYADEISAGDEVKLSSPVIAGDITGGGDWVYETDGIWKRGVITSIRVCAGDAVNRIRVFYNQNPGTEFGGPGGNCDTFKVPEGEYIQMVRVWSGAWMNKIQFVTNAGTESHEYGGPGGNLKEHFTNDKSSLRKIDGKYGNYMNGIKLGFTYPYFIDNFRYVLVPKIKPEPLPLEQLILQEADGCLATTNDTRNNISNSINVKDSHTFSFGGSATLGIETTFTAGVPDIASVGVTTKAELSVSFEDSKTYETETNFALDVPANAPKGVRVEVETEVKRDRVTVPFKYDLVHYSGDNKNNPNNIVSRKTYDGIYRGVQAAYVKSKRTDYDCVTGEPIVQLASNTPAPENDTPSSHSEDVMTPAMYDDEPMLAAVTPDTVKMVTMSNGGFFKLSDNGIWQELSEDGTPRFNFEVMDKDENSLYLIDVDREVLIVLNLARNKIEYAPNVSSEPFDLYDIVDKT